MKIILAILLIASTGFAQLIPVTPAQKTKADVQTKSSQLANMLSMNMTSLYRTVWNNPYKLAPCDAWAALAELGVSAHKLFVAQVTVLAQAGMDVSKLMGDGSTLVDNADGTVSCTPPAPPVAP